jgi:hypothetical protein
MLAIANDYVKSRVLGMVTADIPSLGHGIVTREGLVNGLDTSAFSSGDTLFLSPTVAGAYQTGVINDGNFDVRVGVVVKDDATTGSILVCHTAAHYTVETTQKTGWSNEYGPATLSFDNGTRTLTITPVGADFHFYQDGIKYSKTTDSYQIADTEGIHAIYYNLGVLTSVVNPTNAQIESIIRSYPSVAYVGWNATDNEAVYFGNELHDMQFPDLVHVYAHFAFGARYLSGLALTDILSEQTGASNTHAQFGVESGAIADEDRYIPTATIASTTGLPIFYLAGTTAAPVLRKLTNAGYSVSTTGTGRLAYNFLTGGNWTIAEVASTNFVLCHVFCINENDIAKRMVAFMGQAQYATVALARAGAESEITTLVSTGIVPKEIKSIGTVIFQTSNAYANAVKARIREVATGIDYEDWRSVNNTGGSVATSGSGTTIFSDADFQVFDNIDPTKSFQFQASPITTGTNAILTVPPATDTLAGLAAVQSFTNKTVEDSLTVKQVATPSTPAAGYNKRYPKADGIERSLLPSGKEIAIDTKGDYEFLWDKQISDFVAYDDGASAIPVDGTGGSPSTITIAAAASPINTEAGKLNIDFSKSAANGQGEGMSVAFSTRGRTDYSAVRVCKISVETSANYANNDCGIYLYDVTNSRLIYPADQDIKASSFVSQQQFEFHLSPDSTSYRLITHVQSTNATAYTLTMTVGVYETKTATGPIDTYLGQLTTTGTWTTNTTYTGKYWRIGDRLKGKVNVTTSGAPTTAVLYINLPAGIVIDTTKIQNPTSLNTMFLGACWIRDMGVNTHEGKLVYFTTTQLGIRIPSSTVSPTILYGREVDATSPFAFGASDEINLEYEVPIVGWSSNQVLSEDAGNRLIACDVTSAGLTGINPNNSYVKLNLEVVIRDETASWSTTNYQYTIPETGWYDLDGRTVIAQTNVLNDQYALSIYKNGAASIGGLYVTAMATSAFGLVVSGTKYYLKGDILDLRLYGDGNNSVNTLGTGGTTQLMIAKRSSPQQIAASEKVYAEYTNGTGGTSITEGGTYWTTKITDSHNAYNSATGTFTCPRSGLLTFNCGLAINSYVTGGAGQYIAVQASGVDWERQESVSAGQTLPNATRRVSKNAILVAKGFQITFTTNKTETTAVTTSTGSTARVGSRLTISID